MRQASFWQTALTHAAYMCVLAGLISYGKPLATAHPWLTGIAGIAVALAYGLGLAALIKYAPAGWKRPN